MRHPTIAKKQHAAAATTYNRDVLPAMQRSMGELATAQAALRRLIEERRERPPRGWVLTSAIVAAASVLTRVAMTRFERSLAK